MIGFLERTFGGFDHAFFVAMNNLAKDAGGFFSPFFKIITFFGEGGMLFLLLGGIFLLFSKTRKMGLSVLLAVCIGALFTNIIIKPTVSRPRPYTVDEYAVFWQFVGASNESVNSFPSGHTTSAMAFATAFFITGNKKYSWTGFVVALLMGLSRIYLIVHYASDVLGGLIVGGVAGSIASTIIIYFYRYCEAHMDNKFCRFITDFDIYASLGNRKEPLPEGDTNPIVEEVPELTEEDTKSLYERQKEIEDEEKKAQSQEIDTSDLSDEDYKKAQEILNQKDIDTLSGESDE